MRTQCPNCHAELVATVTLERHVPRPLAEPRLLPSDRTPAQRIAGLILTQMESGGPRSASEIRRAISHRDRPHFEAAVDLLEQNGLIEVTRTARKVLLAAL